MPLFMDVHRKAPEGAKAKDVADEIYPVTEGM